MSINNIWDLWKKIYLVNCTEKINIYHWLINRSSNLFNIFLKKISNCITEENLILNI